MKHFYCVVYLGDGTYYRFRRCVNNKREARQECVKGMGVSYKDIVEIVVEE